MTNRSSWPGPTGVRHIQEMLRYLVKCESVTKDAIARGAWPGDPLWTTSSRAYCALRAAEAKGLVDRAGTGENAHRPGGRPILWCITEDGKRWLKEGDPNPPRQHLWKRIGEKYSWCTRCGTLSWMEDGRRVYTPPRGRRNPIATRKEPICE
jgi:hypothetical protein